ncbi:ribosome silencing factor [Parasphaerochaeta coccoides]|uniref:Ribosomal silencing factor RsfS n=1 Tax=Parasphaerochaeta coccoides (strain ATCC BAA-1237 / DSM 17374 / SPN1) TaxID=760011 RepID=F4GJF5_PARC1|nr:ribosome silencing factor [Parasphaerochaeta coccoides]AEC02220.1 iojap-like protein [Parasphaerochaeta coccoides DSM 17374]
MSGQRKDVAEKIVSFINDHKGMDTVLLDVSGRCSFADFFIVTTVSSIGHLNGIVHNLWGELQKIGVDVSNRHKTPGEDGWELVDGGDIIIHLMSSPMREFYGIEKLWAGAAVPKSDEGKDESKTEEV